LARQFRSRHAIAKRARDVVDRVVLRRDGSAAPRFTASPQSGTLLEFDGDDPSIRRMYEDELARKGIAAR
jgi:hypothetical protein